MSRWMRVAVLAVISLPLVAADGETSSRQPVDKPFKTTLTKADKTKLAGTVTAYDDAGFDLQNDKKETTPLAWSDLDAKSVFSVRARLLEKAPADRWLDLGRMLLGMGDGQEWADKAFARALRADPALKERVEQIKAEVQAEKKADSEGSGSAGGDGPAGEAAGPETVGQIEEKFWGKLTDEQMAEAVTALKAFGDETQAEMKIRLRLLETRFFLFYTDLPAEEARNWAGLLDKMYARLCQLFAIDKEINIWRGKALIMVFQKAEDYRAFQQVMHGTDAGWTAGMCHNFGDGTVHIAFYRQAKELNFARLLVHESVHGFLHRYRKPVHIPSWANEGLAEVIAHELVPIPGTEQWSMNRARAGLQEYGGIGADFFRARQIEPWQYSVAETFCQFMIVNNKKGYVAFINGIKDGSAWDESMRQHYGADPDRVVQAYLNWMNGGNRR